MPLVDIINGPNLNLLGHREPEIYGHQTLDDILAQARDHAAANGLAVQDFQSNHEGALIDRIHAARQSCQAIVINPGAYSHTSIALLDALNAYPGLVAEVHLSNIHRREGFRHHSYVSARADMVLCGAGAMGYRLALAWVAANLAGHP